MTTRNVKPHLRGSKTMARAWTELRHGRMPGRGLMRVTGMLWVVRLAMWCVPFSILRAQLDSRRDAHLQRRHKARRGDRSRVARHVRIGSRIVPRCTCLVQALVAEQLLAECGQVSVLRLGAAMTTLDRFSAHAWVECGGKVVIGGDVSGFAEFQHAARRVTR